MKYYFRLIWLLLIAKFKQSVDPMGPCITHFRVWPNDLDLFMHMNNGAYLTIMDLGRIDMLVRAGMLKGVLKNRWYPVVVGETIRFKRPMKLFRRYHIKTEVLCWDHRAFYIQQTFFSDDVFIAKAVVETRFLSTGGEKIQAAEIAALGNRSEPSPPMPNWGADWQRAQPAMSDPDYIED